MRATITWIVVVLVALVLFARLFVFQVFEIAGADMVPTLDAGNVCLGYQWDSHPSRGDLILFENTDGTLSVRRVIGLPGDKIDYQSDMVRINGRAPTLEKEGSFQVESGALRRELHRYREMLPPELPMHRIARDPHRRTKDQPTIAVGAGSYYVLSDSRNHGRDSRDYGVVPASKIRAKVIRRMDSWFDWKKID